MGSVGIEKIDAPLLAKMFLAGAKNLDAKKEWINELNVFPVPDGDTGTNMSMTILSAAKEVGALEKKDMKSVAKAISSGSLRGARGNSGVILSQLFRGFTKVIAHYGYIDTVILAEACDKAVETAYKAVMKPKEGTILTVARGAADKAIDMVDETDDLTVFVKAVIDEAERVLKKTPDMLPVLKQAGVVDSGGQGLVVVLQGAYDALMGKEIDYGSFEKEKGGSAEFVKISPETEVQIKFGYCTEFIIVLDKPLDDREVAEYKAFLTSIGDSIVVVADDEIVKTHVHTNDPGLAIQEALRHGSLSRIKIDNMREEHQERLIKDAEKLAAQQLEEETEKTAVPTKEMGFISVSAGAGLSEIFSGLGVDVIIEGGQTMNPSTDDILNAIGRVPAKNIFVLPNNKNIILAANQAAELSEEKKVYVIPTKTIPQGITALINFMPELSAQENAGHMTDELSNVKSGQITYAVRDTVIDDKEIRQNDFMGIGDAGILSVGPDMEGTLLSMVEQLVDADSGIISLYYGDGVTEDEAQALAAKLAEKYGDLEVEVNDGGQPIYYYILSVE